MPSMLLPPSIVQELEQGLAARGEASNSLESVARRMVATV